MTANLTSTEKQAALPPPPAALLGAGPRTIVIHRPSQRHGFGFTLRHLVVYPPDTLNELYEDARHLAVGAVGAPMDTIFVRSVRAGGPAAAAGLRAGDRVLAVNGEPVHGAAAAPGGSGRGVSPYGRVVALVQREPRTLKLTVVPRDHDLLQKYFSEAAYNPETNQRPQRAITEAEMPAPTLAEHESRLFDAYRRPRALPGPQAPRTDQPEYATVTPSRYEPRILLAHDRRESDTSLPSSVTDSKDSLGSFDSGSTLTGKELDDSIILSRIRKSLEQKEAFLRRPSQPTGWVTPEAPSLIKPKEFYARPQKLQKPAWPPPPTSPPPAISPPPTNIAPREEDHERRKEDGVNMENGKYSQSDTHGTFGADKVRVKQDKGAFVSNLCMIKENTVSAATSLGSVSNGSSATDDKPQNNIANGQDGRYPVPAELQIVTARTRQLEAAKADERTQLYRSELARLTTTKPEPTVALRRREFESKGSHKREARSLDVQTEREAEEAAAAILSGNRITITGSKHIHCPPPEGYTAPEAEKVQMRARSNSTGSEGLPHRRHQNPDGYAKKRFGLTEEQMEVINRSSLGALENGYGTKPQRPTHLSLAPPDSNLTSAATTPASPSPTTPADAGFTEDAVIRRQKKNAQLGEEESAMRRVSYLKATWGDRLHLDSDPELEQDPPGLRSAYRKWRPPRFTDDITPLRRIFEELSNGHLRYQLNLKDSLEKKVAGSQEGETEDVETSADVEGNVQVKMVVSNGKRASDRSWKQVWAVLHGTKLYLFRHHPAQSPGGGGGGGTGAGGAEGGRDVLDVSYSLAVLADDYTKRKHVLRLSTAAGAELLLQAEGAADAQRWLAALKRHSADASTQPAPAPSPAPAAPAPAPAHDCPSPTPPQRSKKIGRNRSPTGPPTPTLPSSPKTKTWKGRMAKQLRRMHGGGSAAPAPLGWLGAPLERCPADPAHPGVPLPVSLCAGAVEAAGLRTVGIYRVPGNAAGVATLAAALDRGEPPPAGDPRWADVHVASSLLKAYLRRLPDSLLTAELYPAFIAADRGPDRARRLRMLVHSLPEAHFETLKFLMEHLRRVVAHSDHNKMEARNLAIVFGPTLVRGAGDDMLAMVNDMSSQCRIIESLVNHYEWYFEEDEGCGEPPGEEQYAPPPHADILIHNAKKIEGKDVSTRDIVSSIISAANRKIQRKPRSKPSDKKEPASPPSPPAHLTHLPHLPHLTTSLAEYDGLPLRNYATMDSGHDRVKKFESEALAMLGGARGRRQASTLPPHTHPASLNTFTIDGTGDLVSSLTSTFDQKLRNLNNSSPLDDGSIPYADEGQEDLGTGHDESKLSETTPSESSVNSDERISPSIRNQELKHAWLARDHRKSSSSSVEETDGKTDKFKLWPTRYDDKPKFRYAHDDEANDDSEKENCGVTKKTEKSYEEKKSGDNKYEPSTDSDKDIDTTSQNSNGEPAPDNDKSLERILYGKGALRPPNAECAKRHSAVLDSDGEPDKPPKELGPDGSKLKRSESLNREPERGENRVLRSESLNCRTEARLQRSESLNKGERLSKVEKSEWNALRRRESSAGVGAGTGAGAGAWRSTKLKRKNGMPERGIKRRHTVGGTKDFDKDGWGARHTRTSSPDLTRAAPAPAPALAPLVPPPRPPLESHV